MSETSNKGGLRPYHRYDDDFKRHAVELTLQGTRTVRQVAKELGVRETKLSEWRTKFAPRPGPSGPRSLEEATREISRLRAELVRMQERENVLKKSLGILSEPPGSGMPGSRP